MDCIALVGEMTLDMCGRTTYIDFTVSCLYQLDSYLKRNLQMLCCYLNYLAFFHPFFCHGPSCDIHALNIVKLTKKVTEVYNYTPRC